ncbi:MULTISPECIES: phosphohexomutase domain-containing protein [Caproicibacterium]|uniref:Phosphomannomutase/phosphoglucomutase n=1 Tax=Caproicibacterium argilliputei TaxID=3030016 RepID=A0AA97D9Q0_9FIRM|nr:phosphomannomutase/phosphoglucomutase [Caproicibacterium argilliputei]WOC32047.1 phosphomannomutase/phosphoglucomutase [Caproicibacterium argilliputei]
MLNADWKHFKSGTDIRGVASAGAPDGQPIDLTDETIEKMTAGFVLWLAAKTGTAPQNQTVSVGHDSRISAARIEAAVLRALTGAGCRVLRCGLASTPSMFMTTVDLGCTGAVQITASHHPFFRNGLKFFTREGGLEGSEIEQILEHAQNGDTPPALQGTSETVDYMAQYSARLRKMIQDGVKAADYAHPLTGFHIVVDAGNGAGGFYAKDVLEPLGADVTGSQFLEPDGMFPNHIPNPENEEAMKSVCAAVMQSHADLGVIFDTDVDRGGAVDHRGREINRNRLVALASAIALENAPGGTVVTDSVTSDGLKTYIEDVLGGKQRRFKRGYKNVIDEALRLNKAGVDCPLAIETSGHAAMRENYFLDDGAYLVTKIIIKTAVLRRQGKALEDLFAALPEPEEAAEVRLPILAEDFRTAGEAVLESLRNCAAHQPHWHLVPDNCEGVRISFDERAGDGWALLRLSVHDPILPLNMESNIAGGAAMIASQLYVNLRTHTDIDASPLETFIAND